MKTAYINKTFRGQNKVLLPVIDQITTEYQDKGFLLTLRSLYYQLVTRKYILNKDSEYNKLIRLATDGRMAGLIDWSALKDESRTSFFYNYWLNEQEFQTEIASSFETDRSGKQTTYIEVWTEKYGAASIIEQILRPYHIPIQSTRGYVSTSLMYQASNRFSLTQKPVKLIYLGDHDPSGLNMVEDINKRLKIFLPNKDIEVIPIALTMDQIEERNLPPDPAKVKDPRAKEYIKRFGTTSWELDALSPEYIQSITEYEVQKYVDLELLNSQIKRDNAGQRRLKNLTEKL